MSVLDKIPLVCPLDNLTLLRNDKTLCCSDGHSYDIARQGYIHLLPVQLKSTRDPGDSKSMVAARRRVLDAGCFEQLANTLCADAAKHLEQFPAVSGCIVDAGCGEGYYSARLADHLAAAGVQSCPVLGVDISKWCVLAAATKYPHIAFSVATNKRLPIAPGAANMIVSLFGFETWQPWSQLQTAGQIVLLVDSGPQHLLELRQQIYPEVRIHEVKQNEQALNSGYEQTAQHSLTYTIPQVKPDRLADILEMTPHGRRTSSQQRLALSQKTLPQLTIDCVIRSYRHL